MELLLKENILLRKGTKRLKNLSCLLRINNRNLKILSKRWTKKNNDLEKSLNSKIDTLEEEIVQLINEKNKLIEDYEVRCKEYDDNIEELQTKLKAKQMENTKLNEKLEDTINAYEVKIKHEKEKYESQIR